MLSKYSIFSTALVQRSEKVYEKKKKKTSHLGVWIITVLNTWKVCQDEIPGLNAFFKKMEVSVVAMLSSTVIRSYWFDNKRYRKRHKDSA